MTDFSPLVVLRMTNNNKRMKFIWFKEYFFALAPLCISITVDFMIKNANILKTEVFQICKK